MGAPGGGAAGCLRRWLSGAGISRQTVSDLAGLRAQAVAPRRVATLAGTRLIEKVGDLVGLYLSPPVAAAVYALDREAADPGTQPVARCFPMLPTTPSKATHDYVATAPWTSSQPSTSPPAQSSPTCASPTQPQLHRLLEQNRHRGPGRLDVHVILDNLSHPQNPRRARVAAPPARSASTLTHLRILDKPGRTLVSALTTKNCNAQHTAASKLSQPTSQAAGRKLEPEPDTLHLGTRPPTRSSTASPATAARSTNSGAST